MKSAPRANAASAMSAQFAAIALALTTAAGRCPSTCGVPGSKRAADHVVHGGDATTATHNGDDANWT
eukprot:535137-Pleurochrysis_carterae.AAC.1